MGDKLINTQNLYNLLDLEPFFIVCALMALTWVFYKVFLKEVSEERHRNLKNHFSNLLRHFFAMAAFFGAFLILKEAALAGNSLGRAMPYVGVISLLWGMIVFVKICRLITLQYLFLGSMKHGVPVLIVNIFSLILTIVLVMWAATALFDIKVTPLLATSAAFSIILGLALQDTLGNLFAGISLQFDHTFDIGDWLEVTQGSLKTSGQVKEITWRATVLTGWTDEVITLPNRTLASSQIANFSLNEQPIIRSQFFRLDYGIDHQLAKQCLLESIKEVRSVRTWPEPLVLVTETSDSFLSFKLIYYIDNYGSQYTIGDQVVETGWRFLKVNGILPAKPKLHIEQ